MATTFPGMILIDGRPLWHQEGVLSVTYVRAILSHGITMLPSPINVHGNHAAYQKTVCPTCGRQRGDHYGSNRLHFDDRLTALATSVVSAGLNEATYTTYANNQWIRRRVPRGKH